MIALATVFLVLSGISALTYQVAWVRLLGLSMGSTSASVSTVLAAFFFGLAAGSLLAERLTRNMRGFGVYLALEAVIAISALALVPVLLRLDALLALVPAVGTSLAAKFALTVVLLAPATVCMGATFPVMTVLLARRQSELGARLSHVYAFNTFGAVLGALLCGFVFIPNLGLDGAVMVGAALNATVVVLGLIANAGIDVPAIDSGVTPVAVPGAVPSPTPGLRRRALAVLCATGFVSIAVEVGWTKYLSIFTGATLYGFASILGVFLAGIACGSYAAKVALSRVRARVSPLVAGLILLGVSLLASRAVLSAAPEVYGFLRTLSSSPAAASALTYGYLLAALFVPTFLFGALFPLGLELYCGDVTAVRERVGRAYALNTVASIIGSIAAGFWLIPTYGTDTLLVICGVAILVLPLTFVPLLDGTTAKLVTVACVVAAVAIGPRVGALDYGALIHAVTQEEVARASPGGSARIVYLREGRAGVISVMTIDGRNAALQSNGLSESHLDLVSPEHGSLVETLLGVMPIMLHPDPRTAFVVGFGGGNTTLGMTKTRELDSIRVVELEPAIVDAVRTATGGNVPALRDPRVELLFNDARNSLIVDDATYDVIASQPSHPWLAGNGSLFTVEFFRIVRSRLATGGVFGQWVNLFHMDADTLRSILAAFAAAFPHAISLVLPSGDGGGDLLLFGSADELVISRKHITERLASPALARTLALRGVRNPIDLLGYFALSRSEILAAAGDAEPNSDTNLISEVRLAAHRREPSGNTSPLAFLRSRSSLDVLPYLETADAEAVLAAAARAWAVEQGGERRARHALERLAELAPERAGTLAETLGLR